MPDAKSERRVVQGLALKTTRDHGTRQLIVNPLYWGADKALARKGRKQANVSVRMARISFGALHCKGGRGELYDSSRLDVVEIARVPEMIPSLFPYWWG